MNAEKTVGLPLAEQWLGKRRAPLVTAGAVPSAQPSGTGYEPACLPGQRAAPAGPTRVQHTLRAGSGCDERKCRPDPQAQPVEGLARPEPGSRGARLRIGGWPAALRGLPWVWRMSA